MASNSNPSNNASNLLMPEIGPDGLARENPVIAYTEKMIEAEQSQLRKYIEENYSKIRDVERELASLTMEMKLTAGPKKAALELLRKKIEMSTEKIRAAKLKEEQAKKAWEAASKAVQDEEAAKQKLCDDLNQLVQESSSSQLARLEELKRRMEALNPSRSSTLNAPGVIEKPPQSMDSSAVPSTSQPASIISTSVNEGINPETSTTIINSKNQTPQDGEGRGKKKNIIQGKVKGIGAVPKGRVASASGSASPGWTGAGFDIDGRG